MSAALEALAHKAIAAIGTGGHSHWREGGAGGRCSSCERATARRDELHAELEALLTANNSEVAS